MYRGPRTSPQLNGMASRIEEALTEPSDHRFVFCLSHLDKIMGMISKPLLYNQFQA